eukprot:TRINITY_DN2952_c0_g2_i1.p1 TRINITY_DN2952_c0_g2~~TRINITY_DN2952_c0_g2_i1.p1  ORF type:complete len:152 (+),score=42.33 TRINITY_DN2952_c0_g2_i1:120-575(+)
MLKTIVSVFIVMFAFALVVEAREKAYVLAMQKCNSSSPDFTLHGLWPEWAQDCPAPSFNQRELSSILGEMNMYWLSCPGFGTTNTQFWTHEWKKHGSCSNMTELNFFSTALKLRQQYASRCQGGNKCEVCLTKDLAPCSSSADGVITINEN